ncbi:MAG: isoprenylcysteine carboxylmethyltransferase family protein [Clostridia bacterium]|nr:isoprenylcysteine carboxylmethyltransferase family protein [Clostridia bacterium]
MKNLKLFLQAITKFLLGVLLVGVLLFLPAGSLAFFSGWILMGILFVPMFAAGIVMLFKNPDLLKSRLNAKEKRRTQDIVVKLSGLMFLLGFIVSGLGFRFGWYTLPKGVSIASAVVFLAAYVLYAEVLRENTYLSRTIEVRQNQKVINTGLYSVVRHPMYSATLLLFLSIPLVLGSIYSFLIFLAYPFLIAKRIRDEEKFLEKELNGYREYKQKVKYKLIPFIW